MRKDSKWNREEESWSGTAGKPMRHILLSVLDHLTAKVQGKLCLQTYALYKHIIYHIFTHRSEKEMDWLFVEMQTLFKWTSHIPSVVNEWCNSPNGTKLTSLSSSVQKSSKFVWNPGCSLSDILQNISSACQHNSSAISFYPNLLNNTNLLADLFFFLFSTSCTETRDSNTSTFSHVSFFFLIVIKLICSW